MPDTLSLGGITFDGYSSPNSMMGGGRQAMVMHKLPGGSRVIDTLGPDDSNIVWNGFFWGNDAYITALTLDALRAAGKVIPLIWGGQFRSVLIDQYIYRVRKFPMWVEYEISCTVYQNPSQGNLSAGPSVGQTDALVSSDLGTASSAAGLSPAQQLAAGIAPV